MPPIRFLALGDSYTIGEAVTEAERWPNQLAELLNARGFDASVQIIAKTGWTTGELWAGIQQTELDPPYELVSLLVGVNNQYRGLSIDEYRKEFTFLLSKAIDYAGKRPARVLVLSIPDWGVTPYAATNLRLASQISGQIDLFNIVNREESQKVGVHYVDIVNISRLAFENLEWLAVDELHPSGKMYAEWAKLALLSMLKTLE